MRKYKSYTIVNNEVLNTPAEQGGLDGFELVVYMYALKSQNNPNFYFSAKRICKHYRLGELVITRAIASLEAKGILRREYYNDEKGYRRAFYYVGDTLTPCENEFIEDEDMLVLSPDAPPPNANYKPQEPQQEAQQSIPQEKPQTPKQETPKNTSGHIQQIVKSQEEIIQEQVKEKARFIYDNFNANNSLNYDIWLDWARYKQSVSKFDIVALELVLKQSINMLNGFKERANEAIEYSIACGYKGLFLPKIDEPKQEQQKPLQDNQVTRAGITIPVRYDLFVKSDEYIGMDYNKEFWDIIKCKNPNELSKFLLEGYDIEVREHLNEIIDLRIKFLQSKRE